MSERTRASVLAGGTGLLLSVAVLLFLLGADVVGHLSRPPLASGRDGHVRVNATPVGAPGNPGAASKTTTRTGGTSPGPSPSGPGPASGGGNCSAPACGPTPTPPPTPTPGSNGLTIGLGSVEATLKIGDSLGVTVTLSLGQTHVQLGLATGPLKTLLRPHSHAKKVKLRLRK
jgi:hypothetical protein